MKQQETAPTEKRQHDPAPTEATPTEKQQAAPTEATPAPQRQRDPVRRLTLWLIGLAIVVFFYTVIADRLTPMTSQAYVNAFIAHIAPEVPGRIVEVPITDNQRVDAGDLLFRIDPSPYEIAVSRAEAQLAAAGQAVGANTAAVETAEAQVAAALANRDHMRAQAGRVLEAVERKVLPVARGDQAEAALKDSEAKLNAALAELERARQNLGSAGQDNPQIREAAAQLRDAQLDLLRTRVIAPGEGVVTNLQLTPGQYIAAGQGVLTFIDTRAVWITAQLRENSLEYVRPGTTAEVMFDALPGRVFSATIESIGWGVGGVIATDPATGLPSVQSASGTSAFRFPVQLVLDAEQRPRNLRYSSRATVVLYAAGVGITIPLHTTRRCSVGYCSYWRN